MNLGLLLAALLGSIGGSASTALHQDPLERLTQHASGAKTQQLPNSRRGINFSFEEMRLLNQPLCLHLHWVFDLAEGEIASDVLEDKYVLQEADGSQSSHPATRRYHYAAQPLAVTSGGVTSYLNVDALGSVTDATSGTGALTSAKQYDAWGQYRNGTTPTATEPKLGFTGHQFDVETGLVYARARYLDPELGIFLSRDSVEGTLNDAPSLHRFNYVRNNPMRYTDPTGHCIFQSCKELWEEITGSETTGAPQPPTPVKIPQPAKPKEYSVVESNGTQEKFSAAEKKAKGIGPTPRTFKHYFDLLREEEERKAQTQLRGTILVAGMTVMVVAPEIAPLLVETAGVSATAAAGGVAVASTAAGAGQEYGLTGEVKLKNLAAYGALSSLPAARSLGELSELQVATEAAQAAKAEGFAAAARTTLDVPKVRVYRVEGTPNTRVTIGANGEVAIEGDSTLFLNFGSRARAEEFLAKRIQQGLPGASMKSFEVPKSFLEDLRSAGVKESLAGKFPGRPLIVDTTKAPDQFGLRPAQQEELRRAVVSGSGKVE